MSPARLPAPVLLAAAALTTSACTSDGGFAEPCHEITLAAEACDPDLVDFTLDSTNPFYPLTVGLTVILEGEEDGETERVERTVLEETRTVAGVEVHVLQHDAYIDGEIHEIAYNFYVESTEGTVCYFGEDVEFYEDGALDRTDGTWRVGQDGAKPGVIMPADPQVGDVYYQEVAPGIAEDQGRVEALDQTLTLGGEEWTGLLVVQDSNPIDDEEACVDERKVYAPGIGEIADVALEVVEVVEPG